MFWLIRHISTCCLVASLLASAALAEENCTVCHKGIRPDGRHAALTCLACHLRENDTVANPAAGDNHAVGCTGCHAGHERIFDHAMATHRGEQRFVERSFAKIDSGFRGRNCSSCHVRSCLDCHGDGHAIRRPVVAACQSGHKGCYTSCGCSGRAQRKSTYATSAAWR